MMLSWWLVGWWVGWSSWLVGSLLCSLESWGRNGRATCNRNGRATCNRNECNLLGGHRVVVLHAIVMETLKNESVKCIIIAWSAVGIVSSLIELLAISVVSLLHNGTKSFAMCLLY